MAIVFTPETVAGKLQVENKFKELVAVATGADSAYIKAKESMQEYFKTDASVATLSEREKAEMLSKLVGDMSISITNHMMDTALKIEMENRDAPYALAKVVADVKLTTAQTNKVDEEDALVEAQKDKIVADINKMDVDNKIAQAVAYSKTGMQVYANGHANALPSYSQATTGVEPTNVRSTEADRYSKLASSFRRDGYVNITGEAAPTGLADGSQGYVCLTEAQIDVAIRQEKGFDDNMLQHAVNSSANLMGLMISSENADLLNGSWPTTALPATYKAALEALTVNANTPGTTVAIEYSSVDTATGTYTKTTTENDGTWTTTTAETYEVGEDSTVGTKDDVFVGKTVTTAETV